MHPSTPLVRRRELLCSLVASLDSTIAVKSNATAADAGGESEQCEVAAPPRIQPTFFRLALTLEIFLLLSVALVRCLMGFERVRFFPPRAVHQLPLFNTPYNPGCIGGDALEGLRKLSLLCARR